MGLYLGSPASSGDSGSVSIGGERFIFDPNISIGETEFTIRCGALSDEILCATLKLAGIQGIVGNEILNNCVVGYFPRRNLMVSEFDGKRENAAASGKH